jgi:hypothetical protein
VATKSCVEFTATFADAGETETVIDGEELVPPQPEKIAMEEGPVNIKTTPKAQLDLRTRTSFRFLYKCGEPSDRGRRPRKFTEL